MAKPRIVMLHGFTGSGASFDGVVEQLPEDWTIWRPDLVGHGEASDVEVASFDGEVDRLLEGLGPASQRWNLVGYSMGARVALALLLRSPERFASATLVGGHPGLEDEHEKRTRIAEDERWAETIEADVESFLDRWSRLPLFASQQNLPRAALEQQQRIRSAHTAPGLARAMRVLSLGRMSDHRPGLRRLAQLDSLPGVLPVRLLIGSLDSKFLELGRELIADLVRAAAATSGRAEGGNDRATASSLEARLEIVEGAGHNVVLEAPRAIAQLLLRTTIALSDPIRSNLIDVDPMCQETTG